MATKKAAGTPAKKSAKAGSTDTEIKPAAESAATKTPAKSTAKKAAASETHSAEKKSASHDDIAKHAHGLWEKGGRSHGSHVEHWLRAEKELNG